MTTLPGGPSFPNFGLTTVLEGPKLPDLVSAVCLHHRAKRARNQAEKRSPWKEDKKHQRRQTERPCEDPKSGSSDIKPPGLKAPPLKHLFLFWAIKQFSPCPFVSTVNSFTARRQEPTLWGSPPFRGLPCLLTIPVGGSSRTGPPPRGSSALRSPSWSPSLSPSDPFFDPLSREAHLSI